MKRFVLVCIAALWTLSVTGQNPFAEYGYTPKIATLSKGQFNEFHDQDTVVQIGSVLYNTKTKQIVAFVETDTVFSEATLQPDIVSRWISPDPLADHPTQMSLTPYHYAGNNPIVWTDPDGRCPWCVVWLAVEVGFMIYDAYDAYQTINDPNLSAGQKAGIVTASAASSLLLPGGGYGTATKQTVKAVDKAIDTGKALEKTTPAWKKSEQFIEKNIDGGEAQKVFKGGEAQQTAQRVKGSSVVDVWDKATNTAFEVKNYAKSLASGNYSGLVSNMSKQYQQRLTNLPEGAKQVFKVDITDVKVSKEMQTKIIDSFMKGKDPNIVQVQFFTRQ